MVKKSGTPASTTIYTVFRPLPPKSIKSIKKSLFRVLGCSKGVTHTPKKRPKNHFLTTFLVIWRNLLKKKCLRKCRKSWVPPLFFLDGGVEDAILTKLSKSRFWSPHWKKHFFIDLLTFQSIYWESRPFPRSQKIPLDSDAIFDHFFSHFLSIPNDHFETFQLIVLEILKWSRLAIED